MKHLFLLSVPLFAVSACALQPAAPPVAAAPTVQLASTQRSVSSVNPTNAYDGTYAGVIVENVSNGSALAEGGDGLSTCVDYGVPPALTISNGLAQFQAHNVTYQGYVTPQGGLTMRTGLGHKFEGHIDNQYALRGRIVERCTYNLSWQRSS
jgi:ABC-type transport system substrate-binding protein